MFGVDYSEALLVAVVALVVIGPKDLPKAMRVVGYWVGRARGVARQFRQGFDSMVREAELEEMEKKWAAENERIMREHPQPAADPVPDPADDLYAAERAAGEPVSDEAQQPVTVEQPHILPAPEGTPSPRGDGVTS